MSRFLEKRDNYLSFLDPVDCSLLHALCKIQADSSYANQIGKILTLGVVLCSYKRIVIKLFWENMSTKSKDEEITSPEEKIVIVVSSNYKNRSQKQVRGNKSSKNEHI